jgi:hypothetical protein
MTGNITTMPGTIEPRAHPPIDANLAGVGAWSDPAVRKRLPLHEPH